MSAVAAEIRSDHLLARVTGMTCSACAARLEKALLRASGVQSATVNFATEQADIVFDPASIDVPSVVGAIERAGFGVGETTFTFGVGGMTCSACATRIEKQLRRLPGVLEANVNVALERADVRAVFGQVDQHALERSVEAAGFTVHFPDDAADADHEEEHREKEAHALRRDQYALIASALLTLPLVAQMVTMVVGMNFHLLPWVELALATPVQFLIGARFYRAAWKAIRAGSGNMDVLVAMGTTTAYAYSVYLMASLGDAAAGRLYFEASAVIITLVMLGKYMEARAKRGTTAAIRQLMDLRPKTARLERGGAVTEVPVAQVRAADLVVVRPGEAIPVDGVLADGRSEVDESLITGESIPVVKVAGDKVTAVGADSTLAKIIRLVENAQSGKAPIQRLVDRISELFVPTVLLIAGATFAGWFFYSGNLESALISAVSVMVIACPCALGLATPTAIMTGTGAAARWGILIKDVEMLERAHALNAVIFDKTGTLTTGHPTVVDILARDGDSTRLLAAVASLQQGSEHPLAKAVLDRAAADGVALTPVSDFRSHTGHGVAGRIDGASVISGNEQFMRDNGVPTEAESATAAAWEDQGKTVIWVARAGELLGLVAIADPLRPESAPAVAQLKRMGIRTLLLSGDAVRAVAEIGRQVGIDEAQGGVKPADKSRQVEALRDDGYRVGMIGDGINDAPALAAADVGIAMGSGTDVAMETAGVTLMRSDPGLVPGAISISRATWNKIRQNLFWAFIYNVIGIPFAAAGYLSPTIAGAAMAFSSVSVVTNSLLLKRWRP